MVASQSNYIRWKNWCWSWSSITLAIWCEEPTHWNRPWCWERLSAGGERGDRGWDDWIASSTQWTWVWANSCINIVHGCIAGPHVDWKGLFIFKQTDEEGDSPPPQLDLDWWGHTMGFSTPAINRSLFVVWKRKREVQEKGGVIRR